MKSEKTEFGEDNGNPHEQQKPDVIMATVQQSLPAGGVFDASMKTELGDDHKKEEDVHFGSDDEQTTPQVMPPKTSEEPHPSPQ